MPRKPTRPPEAQSTPPAEPVLSRNLRTAPLDVREFDDRAVKWVLEPPENLRGVFQVLEHQLGDRLDFDRMQPLPTSLIPAALRSRDADLLVRIPYRSPELAGTPEVIVFVLMEHQSEPDDLVVFWLLYDMVLIWEKQIRRWKKAKTQKSQQKLSPIIPVLVYTGERGWNIPLSLDAIMVLPELCAPYVPKFDFLSLNTPSASRESLAKHPIGSVLEALTKASGSEAEMEALMLTAMRRLEGLEERDRDAWERATIVLYLLMYHRRTAEESARLSGKLEQVLEAKKEEAVIMRTMAQVLKEEGEKIGEVRGIRRVVGDLLRQKFGDLPDRVENRLLTMDAAALQTLALAVQSARSLDDLGL